MNREHMKIHHKAMRDAQINARRLTAQASVLYGTHRPSFVVCTGIVLYFILSPPFPSSTTFFSLPFPPLSRSLFCPMLLLAIASRLALTYPRCFALHRVCPCSRAKSFKSRWRTSIGTDCLKTPPKTKTTSTPRTPTPETVSAVVIVFASASIGVNPPFILSQVVRCSWMQVCLFVCGVVGTVKTTTLIPCYPSTFGN